MPLFEGHRTAGLQRLFIEMPDDAKGKIAWKWPDQQIIQHSQLNVDLDYQAVFTNLGKVIGVMGPGRYPLDEGASLALGWLVDRLTGNAYYDAEVYFVATRDIPNLEFGGPVDNLTDGPTGLVVTREGVRRARVQGHRSVVAAREAHRHRRRRRLRRRDLDLGQGPDAGCDPGSASRPRRRSTACSRWASSRMRPRRAALAKANEKLSAYGIAITTFAELNVNLPDADAQQLKQLAATKAYTQVAGSFDSAVRGEAALEIAQGVADGHVGAQPAVVAGMMMGVPVAAGAAPAAAPVAPAPAPTAPAPQQPVAPAATATAAAVAPAPAAAPPPRHRAAGRDRRRQQRPSRPRSLIRRQARISAASAVLRSRPDDRFCPNCGAAVSASGQ